MSDPFSFVKSVNFLILRALQLEGAEATKVTMTSIDIPPEAPTWCTAIGDLEDLRLIELCDQMMQDPTLRALQLGGADDTETSDTLRALRLEGAENIVSSLDQYGNEGFAPSSDAWFESLSPHVLLRT